MSPYRTKHCFFGYIYIYIFYTYVSYSWPNGWKFLGMCILGVTSAKNLNFLFTNIHGQCWAHSHYLSIQRIIQLDINPETRVYTVHCTLYSVHHIIFRVTHKGWDCKDELKLCKYDDSQVLLSLLLWIKFFISYFMI